MDSWSEGTIKRKKQGRKTKDPKDLRCKQIRVRLTEDEYEELKDISRYTGYNFSEILRYSLKEEWPHVVIAEKRADCDKEDTDCAVCFKESHCKALAKAYGKEYENA